MFSIFICTYCIIIIYCVKLPIFCRCWSANPVERPSMREIVRVMTCLFKVVLLLLLLLLVLVLVLVLVLLD